MSLRKHIKGRSSRARRFTSELLEQRKLLAIDLAVHIGGSDDPVMPGDEVTYAVTVSNRNTPATNARLQSDMSDMFVSVSWLRNGKEVATGDIDTRIDLAADERVTYEVTAIAGPIVDEVVGSRVSVSASVSQTETRLSNNEMTLTHRSPQLTQIPRHLAQVNICKDQTFLLGDDLYFIGWNTASCEVSRACASSGPYSGDLWKTDGTPEGTHQVKQIRGEREGEPGIFDAFQNPQFTDYRGILYFIADDGIHGEELWRSDGTESGTYLVKDINPTIRSEFRFCTELDYNQPSQIRSLQVMDDMLVFTAKDESGERKSWISDGTQAGTQVQQGLVIPPRAPDPPSSELAVTFEDDRFYVSSGTPESRRVIADWPQQVRPPWVTFRDPNPTNIHVIGDKVIFNSNRGFDENHLLVLDLEVDSVEIFDGVPIDLSRATLTSKSFATEFLGFTSDGDPGVFLPCDACTESPDLVLGNNDAVFPRQTDTVDIGFPAPVVDGPGDDITINFGVENLLRTTLYSRTVDGRFKRLGKVTSAKPGLDFSKIEWEEPVTALRIEGQSIKSVEANIEASTVLSAKAINHPDLKFSWDLNNDGIFGDQVGRSVGLTVNELQQFGLDKAGEYEISVRMNDRVNDYFDTALLTVVGELPLFGDLDLDGQVAFKDFLIMSANFGNQNAAATQGDIDGNNRIDFADFIILAHNFGRSRAMSG